MKNIYLDDSIAAVSTPIGSGGISIIRISGHDSVEVADKIFVSADGKKLADKKSHTISYGHIVDPKTGETIDEVLISLMLSPRTYTKENVVEINCHGGMLVTNRVLELVFNNGARAAEPGEFTKRAFLNGRIDLSQAEAVMDIIESKSELSRRAAMDQLGGSLKKKIGALREEILDMTAAIEAAIDYPEHDVEEETRDEMKRRITSLRAELKKLIDSAGTGRIIREGVEAVILGRPNVGKSSLLNYLLMEDRAIVTDIPGTTRDTVEEYMNMGGVPVRIVDTAGIRETGDAVEMIGVDKSRKRAENADIIFMMLDGSESLTPEDREILEFIRGKKALVIINKTDAAKMIEKTELLDYTDEKNIFYVSVKEESGLDELKERFREMFIGGDIDVKESALVTNARHKNMLAKADEALERAFNTAESGMPEDFISMDLQDALAALGEITGESVDGEIIDRIFTRFCLGK